MKKLVGFVSLLTVVLISLVSCTTSFGLIAVDTPENTITVERGKVYQSVVDDDVALILHGKDVYDDNKVSVIVGLSNLTNKTYEFNDSQIEIYTGNVDDNHWEKAGNWDAQSYYQQARKEAGARKFWTGFANAMYVASAALGSTSNSTVYSPGSGYQTISTRTYNPANVAITGMLASQEMDRVVSSNELTLSFLQQNLLYDTQVDPYKNYFGLLLFPVDKNAPDYKLSFRDHSNKTMEFFFSRTDREEIINPWLDKSKSRHSVLFSHAIGKDKMSLTYSYSKPTGIGWYTGLSLYNMLNKPTVVSGDYYSWWSDTDDNFSFDVDPDPSDDHYYYYMYDGSFIPDGKKIIQKVGIPIGITIKIVPYWWLTLGCEISGETKVFYRGSLKYKYYSESVFKTYSNSCYVEDDGDDGYFSPQVGMNFIINHISANIMLSYTIGDQLYLDLGIGYAF